MKNLIRMMSVVAIAAVALATVACRAPAASSNISVKDAWARPTATKAMAKGEGEGESKEGGMAMEGPVSAIYLVIDNAGGADKLITASTDVSEVTEIHETKDMGDGKMGMQPVVGGLDVPANGNVTLKPGGYHIMLMKLKQDLTPGQLVKLTMTFQSGKEIALDVPVKEPVQESERIAVRPSPCSTAGWATASCAARTD